MCARLDSIRSAIIGDQMTFSRQQLWPSIALLAMLAVTVGYIVYAVADREPPDDPAPKPAAGPGGESAAVSAPLPTPQKDPFAAPVPSADAGGGSGTDAEVTQADGEVAGPHSEPGQEQQAMLVGVVTGERAIAVIRVGDARYYAGVGDTVAGLGRVIQVGRDSVALKGPSGVYRMTMAP
jgi:hypothetical protein